MNDCPQITLRIDSNLQCVRLVGLAVRGICSDLGLGQERAFCIELAVCEAVNNVIEHAYAGRSGHQVWVVVFTAPKHLTIEVKDTGMSFDISSHVPPVPEQNPISCAQDLPYRGRGLGIISSIMDTWAYSKTSDGHNVLCMTKELGPWV
ncbi:MAG: ATP-binding protein [Desulfovermiculus sp.]